MNEKSKNIMDGEMITGICSSVEPVVITEQAVLAMISKGYTIHMNSSPSENDAGAATVSFDFYPGDYERPSIAGKVLTSETLVNGHWVDDATGVKVSADTIKMDGAHTVRATNGTIKDMDDDSKRKSFFESMDGLKTILRDAEEKKVYHPNELNLAAQAGIVCGHSVCGTLYVPRYGAMSGLPDIGEVIEAPRIISFNTFEKPYPVHFSIEQATVIGQIEFGSDGNRHVVVEWRNLYPDGPKFDVIPKELISRVVG